MDLLNSLDVALAGKLFTYVLRNSIAPNATGDLNLTDLETFLGEESKDGQLEKAFEVARVVLCESVYRCFSENNFGKQLVNAGVLEKMVRELMEIWSKEWPQVNDRLTESSFAVSPHRLVDANWKLKLVSGHSLASCAKEPLVQIDLTCSSQRSESLEFDHAGLSRFYKELETIQSHIDLIQKQ